MIPCDPKTIGEISAGFHSRPCACGKKTISGPIRIERLGRKHERIHDLFECYEVKADKVIRRWKKGDA